MSLIRVQVCKTIALVKGDLAQDAREAGAAVLQGPAANNAQPRQDEPNPRQANIGMPDPC
jgi:hypothetical protein